MEIAKLDDFYRGWIVGDFDNSILKTNQFEVGVASHKKGEYWAPHKHNIITEYNLLLKGSMTIRGSLLKENDIFIIKPGEVADPVFHEDCQVLIIKVPSVPGDKIIIC